MKVKTALLATLTIATAAMGLVLINQAEPAPAAKLTVVKREDTALLSAPLEGVDKLVNAERAERGLPALHLNADLNDSAEAKAKDMVAKDYWAHEAPDGTMAWDLIEKAGYQYTRAGENLGKCYNSLDALVAAWIASPTHLKNIVGDYEDFGFGYATKADGCMVVVNHFGRG